MKPEEYIISTIELLKRRKNSDLADLLHRRTKFEFEPTGTKTGWDEVVIMKIYLNLNDYEAHERLSTEDKSLLQETMNEVVETSGNEGVAIQLNIYRDFKSVKAGNTLANSILSGDADFRERGHKATRFIENGDYEDAIKTAKSVLEHTLKDILNKKGFDYNQRDSLTKILRNTERALNMDNGNNKMEKSLRKILGGCGSIVNGITELRNPIEHESKKFNLNRHHAEFAVNATFSLAYYLIGVYNNSLNKE